MPEIIQFRQSAKTVSLQETVEEPDIYHTLSSLTHYPAKLKAAIDAIGSSNVIAGTTKPTCEQSTLDGNGATSGNNVRILLDDNQALPEIILPLLKAWYGIREQAAELGRQLISIARASQSCPLLMSVSAAGVVTATSFVTANLSGRDLRLHGRRQPALGAVSAAMSIDVSLTVCAIGFCDHSAGRALPPDRA